jgi:hypothetical protein
LYSFEARDFDDWDLYGRDVEDPMWIAAREQVAKKKKAHKKDTHPNENPGAVQI